MNNIDCVLDKLSKSKFRSSFKLKKKDIEYIDKKGLEVDMINDIKYTLWDEGEEAV